MKTITSIIAILLFVILSFTSGTNTAYAGPRFGFYVGFGSERLEHPEFGRVWVRGHYQYDRFGFLVWVPAHWKYL